MFESVKAAIYVYDLNIDAYQEVLKRYNLKPVSFYFHLPPKEQTDDFFANLDAELNFTANLGVKVLSLQAPWGRAETDNLEKELAYYLDQIMKFAETAKTIKPYEKWDCIDINSHPHNFLLECFLVLN